MSQIHKDGVVGGRKSGMVGLLWPFLLGAGLSLLLLVSDRSLSAVSEFLQLLGSPYMVESNGAASEQGGSTKSSEYLLIVSAGTDLEGLVAYLDAHPHLAYSGESVYPHTLRIRVDIPVGDSLEQLKEQPFTRFVIKNLPLFFCH